MASALFLAVVPAMIIALTVTVVPSVAVASTVTVAPATSGGAEQKYYIVGDARNGQRESLFSVAAATLGNGNRYLEIFALNQSRIQPDGQRLTDPLVINPGWVLELPADASGPDVRIGPIPVYAQPTTPPSFDAAAAGPGGGVSTLDSLPRTIGVLVVVGVLGLALILLRRGQRLGPPARRPRLALPAGPTRAADNDWGPVVTVATRVAVDTPSLARSNGRADPADVPAPVAPMPERSPSPTAIDHNGSSTHHRSSTVDMEVRHGDDLLAVSLLGRRQTWGPPAHTWMGRGEHVGRPAGVVPAALGSGYLGTLVVDLACAPDVITIVGPAEAPRRHARRLAEQLAAAGTRVSATAGTFDESVPTGCRLLRDLDDPGLAHAASPHVVFCPGSPARGRATESRSTSRSIRRLMSRRSALVVVVLVGSPRRSRWSIEVRPATY